MQIPQVFCTILSNFLKVQVQKALPTSMILKFQCIVSTIKVIKMSTKNTYDMRNPCCFNYPSCFILTLFPSGYVEGNRVNFILTM